MISFVCLFFFTHIQNIKILPQPEYKIVLYTHTSQCFHFPVA